MKRKSVTVPASLLLDRHLTASARLLWIFIHLGAAGDHRQPPGTGAGPAAMTPGLLAARSGLARQTVRQGLSQLEAAGWLSPSPSATQSALLPTDLLLDSRVGAREKLLYGTLQLTPGFRQPDGQFTYLELSGLAGVSANTVKSAVGLLRETGWLRTSQANKFSPIRFSLRNPTAQERDSAVAGVSRRLEEAAFKGEALMREYLSLLVESDEYDDNASPGFLVNPYTQEEMQFDRYYPPGVAFEFNGAQHYGPTARFSSEQAANRQQARDLIKLGICVTRGIRLVVLHPEDLTLQAMRRKVDGLLPLRSLDGCDRVIQYLERVSRAYRSQARKQGRPRPDSAQG